MFVYLNKALNHSMLVAGCFTAILSAELYGSNNEIIENNENFYSLNGESNQNFSESEISISVDMLYPTARKFEYGEGVKQDFKKSLYYFNLAIEKNQPQAMYHLGYKHEFGHGVEQNLNKAIELYTNAIEYNHSDAMNQLGKL